MKSSTDKHHHLHIKNPLKSDSGSDSESHSTGSHTGLSRLFRHSSNHNLKDNGPASNSGASNASNPPSGSVSRTGSFLSLKRHNSNPNNRARSNSEHHHHHLLNLIPGHNSGSNANLSQSAPKEGKKLTKAETVAYLQSVNNKNAARAQYRPPAAPLGSGSGSGSGGGVGSHEKMVYNPYGVNKNPSQQTPKSSSFYMSGTDEGGRVLANPVADPNDYLPDEYHQEHINLLDDYEIDVGTKKLGDGGSSDVRIINALNHKKEFYALKKFTLLSKETDQEFYERVTKEFIISRKCSTSRHVADVLALVRIQSQANLTRGWGFVMEWCAGGDLFNTIIKPGWKRTPLNERFCIFKQISYGLKAIHELDIVHRDLKPENVLLDANGCVKLCDFGVSGYGHETPGDFSSPLKTSHSYVGSPPYSPPEVMLLKEKSPSEAKHFEYDPFKMDYWGLGMLLFCIVYGGVPFQMSSVNDHAYRDYKFNHDRYCSDHPHFKNNHDYAKGPGSEFKWASQFQSTGASRVAWKLCDPSVARRYDLDLLFNDPWFQGLEMCLYEHPDQTVNPFVLPGTGLNNQKPSSVIHSNTGSLSNSRNPSRRGTVNHENGESDSEGITTPFRSMLDLVGGSSKPQDHQEDTSSIHSASSLSNHPLNFKRDEKERVESNGSSSGGEEHKLRSMLGIALDPPKENLPKDNLPAVEESSGEHEDEEEHETNEEIKKQPETPEQLPQSSSSSINKTRSSSPTNKKPMPSLGNKILRSSSDLKLDENGTCELGYKIKKHHHLETSTVPVSRMR